MPRRQVKRGGRKFQPEKPLIYVFCEGESEQAYAKFLKEHFADVAVWSSGLCPRASLRSRS